ncbi:MAG: asparagine synthase (glutamine-hydrolyzing) [Pirellulales bacterium]|nr:asparagine synthase (glutamine-hydrolyzing) [Pirellulales bacterium]
MCGIVGALNRREDASIDETLVRRMLAAVRHRGPDEFGVYTYRGDGCTLGLGNARLSIIDLGGGQQPIGNEDGTRWIVFNGEIYNYLELREELQAQGHRFATNSDTEVLLHLYEQYGPDCLNRLNGQFAFAVWDQRTEDLFLARDRVGIRPLYYTQRAGTLVFASEIKAILAHPQVSVEFDPVALDQIFTHWSPLSPRTAFRGVQTLPPGHWLLAKPSGDVHVKRYWQLTFPDAGSEPVRNVEEAAGQFRELLVDATRFRLRADVPVGAYLSGGLDSSTITALIHHYTGNRLETFSIAFTDAAFDESDFQRQMARHLGTRHHLITCSHADIGRVFPEMIWHTETPIMRASPAPLYLLSELVRKHRFKVVLTGEGADEFLAGYNIFKEGKVRRFWARQPQSTGRPALLQKLYPYVGDLPGGNSAYWQKFFGQRLSDTSSPTYSHDVRWRNARRTQRLFSESLRRAVETARREAACCDGPATEEQIELALPEGFSRWSPLARAQYLEATIFLSEYLLSSQGDRVGMAHSVEGRFPFLDHRVIEFCSLMAPRLKLCGLNEKHLLKKAVQDLLPEVVWRRPKRPYRAPIHASFFCDGRPLPWVAEVLRPDALEAAGCFNPRAVAMLTKKIQRFGTLSETDDMALAGVLSTQIVHQRFVADYRAAAPLNDCDNVKTVARNQSGPGASVGAQSLESGSRT